MCDFSRDGHSSVSTQTYVMYVCLRQPLCLQYQGRTVNDGCAMAHPSQPVSTSALGEPDGLWHIRRYPLNVHSCL